jgi:hypothetical protein
MKISIVRVGLVALSALITACGGKVQVDQDACGKVPVNTIALRQEWDQARDKAEAESDTCYQAYQLQIQDCIDNGEGDELTCPEKYKEQVRVCAYNYAVTMNKPTEERCGAQIHVVPAGADPNNYVGQWNTGDDTDGDGVENWFEFELEIDPCEPNSRDACKGDGEPDSDGDGANDGDDKQPSCYGNSPAACV